VFNTGFSHLKCKSFSPPKPVLKLSTESSNCGHYSVSNVVVICSGGSIFGVLNFSSKYSSFELLNPVFTFSNGFLGLGQVSNSISEFYNNSRIESSLTGFSLGTYCT
jgi:hypothetical protein